jgi:hypothetical protein
VHRKHPRRKHSTSRLGHGFRHCFRNQFPFYPASSRDTNALNANIGPTDRRHAQPGVTHRQRFEQAWRDVDPLTRGRRRLRDRRDVTRRRVPVTAPGLFGVGVSAEHATRDGTVERALTEDQLPRRVLEDLAQKRRVHRFEVSRPLRR